MTLKKCCNEHGDNHTCDTAECGCGSTASGFHPIKDFLAGQQRLASSLAAAAGMEGKWTALPAKCDGNHAADTLCLDPDCWQQGDNPYWTVQQQKAELIRIVLRKAPHSRDCRPTELNPCTCWKSTFMMEARRQNVLRDAGHELAALYELITELGNYSFAVRDDGSFEGVCIGAGSGWGQRLAKKVNEALGLGG